MLFTHKISQHDSTISIMILSCDIIIVTAIIVHFLHPSPKKRVITCLLHNFFILHPILKTLTPLESSQLYTCSDDILHWMWSFTYTSHTQQILCGHWYLIYILSLWDVQLTFDYTVRFHVLWRTVLEWESCKDSSARGVLQVCKGSGEVDYS